ncbi:MAG TPA: hypothetical protein VG474_00950 [Solirubrobacteraceae bacterium]|nr:hypothetical protein [Solirubrobacteraceae bacterium]
MAEVDLERLVLPALLALLVLGAFVILPKAAGITVDRLLELDPSVDPSSLRPGRTLKLAP